MSSLGWPPPGHVSQEFPERTQRGISQTGRQTDTSDSSRQSTDVCLGVAVPRAYTDPRLRGERQADARAKTRPAWARWGRVPRAEWVTGWRLRAHAGRLGIARCLQLSSRPAGAAAALGEPGRGRAVGPRAAPRACRQVCCVPAGLSPPLLVQGFSEGRDFIILAAHHGTRRLGVPRKAQIHAEKSDDQSLE